MEKIKSSVRSVDLLRNGKLKLYDNLKKTDIIDELHQRGIKFYSTQNATDLQDLLTEEMKGIKRAPALLIPNIDNTNLLQNYEVLPNEPLHDIAGHWKNLFEEIPAHLNKNTKKLFQDICLVGLSKETKRAVDYRKTAINSIKR